MLCDTQTKTHTHAQKICDAVNEIFDYFSENKSLQKNEFFSLEYFKLSKYAVLQSNCQLMNLTSLKLDFVYTSCTYALFPNFNSFI